MKITALKLPLHRDPNPNERPSFSSLAANLTQPDYVILKKEDTVDEGAMVIGSPLSLGRKLYTDLQLKYVK